jgi:deoxynucleoside kinase
LLDSLLQEIESGNMVSASCFVLIALAGAAVGAPDLTILDVLDHNLWRSVVPGYPELDGSDQSNHLPRPEAGDELWDPTYFPSSDAILKRVSGRPFTISVEGNVGSGKSTLLEFFKTYPDISVYREPVDMWTNLNGTNFLSLVYQDPKRWGMAFESLVQKSMLEHHILDRRVPGQLTPPVKVMERSVQSCRNCFINQLSTVITPGEVALLDSWHQLMKKKEVFDIDVDVVIYLRTTPDIAFQRVTKRNRQEEMALPQAYFEEMHRLHENWLIHRNSTDSADLPTVIIIDANRDLSTLGYTYRKLAKDVYQNIPKELRTGKIYNDLDEAEEAART